VRCSAQQFLLIDLEIVRALDPGTLATDQSFKCGESFANFLLNEFA
jgi:hypothetical protein